MHRCEVFTEGANRQDILIFPLARDVSSWLPVYARLLYRAGAYAVFHKPWQAHINLQMPKLHQFPASERLIARVARLTECQPGRVASNLPPSHGSGPTERIVVVLETGAVSIALFIPTAAKRLSRVTAPGAPPRISISSHSGLMRRFV